MKDAPLKLHKSAAESPRSITAFLEVEALAAAGLALVAVDVPEPILVAAAVVLARLAGCSE